MRQKTIVIAFDGLDYDLIEKFSLKNLKQIEYGKINNYDNISKIKTSELFASFITGAYRDEHGVEGLAYEPTPLKKKISNIVIPKFFVKNFRGFYRLKRTLETLLGVSKPQRYSKEKLESETIFEEVENSRAMFVPSYNPDIMFEMDVGTEPLNQGYSADRTAKYWDRRAYEVRKKDLFSELDSEVLPARDFLMCHFHRPDIYHHLYGDRVAGIFDEEKLRSMYHDIDELAGEIKQKALEKGYERVIFMSDHGLPTEKAHNTNAFYSSNKELFGDAEPRIVDFKHRIQN